jgi:hypothetical protein
VNTGCGTLRFGVAVSGAIRCLLLS